MRHQWESAFTAPQMSGETDDHWMIYNRDVNHVVAFPITKSQFNTCILVQTIKWSNGVVKRRLCVHVSPCESCLLSHYSEQWIKICFWKQNWATHRQNSPLIYICSALFYSLIWVSWTARVVTYWVNDARIRFDVRSWRSGANVVYLTFKKTTLSQI